MSNPEQICAEYGIVVPDEVTRILRLMEVLLTAIEMSGGTSGEAMMACHCINRMMGERIRENASQMTAPASTPMMPMPKQVM